MQESFYNVLSTPPTRIELVGIVVGLMVASFIFPKTVSSPQGMGFCFAFAIVSSAAMRAMLGF